MSETTLYRIYGEKSELIYVGITGDLDKRLRDHSEKRWWSDVRRIDTRQYQTQKAAATAEKAAIRSENPRENRQHSGAPRPRPSIPRPNSAGKRRLISIDQAAEYLDVSTKTIRRHISAGKLPAYRVGNRLLRVDLYDVEALCAPVPVWNAL